MDRLNEHKVGTRQREKHTKRREEIKRVVSLMMAKKMVNAQMKLKINEREATAFEIMYLELNKA